MPQQSSAGFGIAVGFRGARAVVSVSGDLDALTAPDLDRMLQAVLDTGREQIVLDLADVGFFGGAALDPIAAAAGRLRVRGGQMEVRSAPPIARRLLEVVGLHVGAGAGSVRRDTPDLLRFCPGLTAMPADDLVTAGLGLVVDLAHVVIPHVAGASVSLRRAGVLTTAAASNDLVMLLDDVQYDAGNGPCVEASVAGEPSQLGSPEQDARWGSFVVRVHDEGIRSVLSAPLGTKDAPIGSLNLYSRQEWGFTDADQEVATRLADHAARLVEAVTAAEAVDLFGGQLEEMLAVRDAVSQAQGMLMDRSGTSPEGAFDALRRLAGHTGSPLTEIARDMVEATRRLVDIDLRTRG
jgi:anti-anti-sigma factor